MNNKYQEVMDANIQFHTKLAEHYETCEPQYRPENLARIKKDLTKLIAKANAKRVLDLGCGCGFVINLMKDSVDHITGVDITQAMLDKVDRSGRAKIELFKHDTGTFPAKENSYDLVTAHSFLHHLYDIKPTIQTAYKALRKGGLFYNELDPNYYFWECINKLSRDGNYSSIVKREIEHVTYKDEDIQKNFGVDKAVFNNAEYGKNVKGGFTEEELTSLLKEVGFSDVKITYHWFLGQSSIVNNDGLEKNVALDLANMFDAVMLDILPLSRNLYKYIGFVATK